LVYACPLAELARQTGQTARPGATGKEGPQSFNIPVWARGATETGECHGEKNPVWARVSKNDAIDT